MEIIIQVLALFIFINCIFKLSFWKTWQAAIFGVICAAFIVWSCKFAILQSKTQINDYLSNLQILQNMAVLITIESSLCFAFCFALLQNIFDKKKWTRFLYWYPSLLIFPVLFYVLTQSIFNMPGTDFTTISYIEALLVLILIPGLSAAVKYLFPEKEFRLEVYFVISLFVCIIGLITTVNGNVTYAVAEKPLNIKAIGLSFLLFAIAFLIGYKWNSIKWVLKQRKNKNQLK